MTQVDNEETDAYSEKISIQLMVSRIRRCWKYLLSKRIAILIAVLIGGAIGLTYSFIEKPVYKAELSFALEDQQSSSGGLSTAMGLASQFGIDLGGGNVGGAFSGDNLLILMKSRLMVENSLLTTVSINGKNETLAELYISSSGLREKWENTPKLKSVSFLPNIDRSKFTLLQDSVLKVIYKNIIDNHLSVAKIDKNLSIIVIAVKSKNQFFSKYFTEVLAKTVSNFYINTKIRKSVQNVNILQHQTDSVRRELNAAIGGVASSVDVNPNANPALQILRVPSQRRQVDVQANQAILTQLVANLELSKVSLRKETPLIQVIDRPILPLEKEVPGKISSTLVGSILSVILLLVYFVARELSAVFFKIENNEL
nr:lipopolysaccharide biosynthesis protein [uncultured Mucilaginibacter sp.]